MSVARGHARVAVFSAYYPTHGGGMELATEELVRRLRSAGFEVEWVAQADRGLPYDFEGCTTPLPGSDMVYSLTGIPMPFPWPWALGRMVRAIRGSQLVIVVEANFILSVLGFVLAKLIGKPVAVVQHVGEPSTVSRLGRGIMRLGERLATRPMIESADAVVYVSPVVAAHFHAARLRSPAEIIGHGVDTGQFRPPHDEAEKRADRAALGLPADGRIACFVGRLTESKGLGVVATLARQQPDWTFAIAGSGPVEPASWKLPNVVVLGQLARSDTARLYRASDALVLPSQSESYSLVVREALASDCRVLCADQIIETDPGLAPHLMTTRVDLGDADATAARFSSMLDADVTNDPAAARQYVVETCSWEAAGDRYVSLVEALVEGRA